MTDFERAWQATFTALAALGDHAKQILTTEPSQQEGFILMEVMQDLKTLQETLRNWYDDKTGLDTLVSECAQITRTRQELTA